MLSHRGLGNVDARRQMPEYSGAESRDEENRFERKSYGTHALIVNEVLWVLLPHAEDFHGP